MKYTKIFDAYKKKADLLMNYQLCRAYFGDNCSILRIVEKILLERFSDVPFKEKTIGRVLSNLVGKTNPVVEIPKWEIKMTTSEILAAYVEKRFDKMVKEQLSSKPNYPLTFRDIVERNLE